MNCPWCGEQIAGELPVTSSPGCFPDSSNVDDAVSVPACSVEKLFNEDKTPNSAAIVEFLKLTQEDMEYIFWIPPNMTSPVLYRLRSWSSTVAETIELVHGFFHGDEAKTKLWFSTPNPQLGGMIPLALIHLRRATELLAFVKELLEETEL